MSIQRRFQKNPITVPQQPPPPQPVTEEEAPLAKYVVRLTADELRALVVYHTELRLVHQYQNLPDWAVAHAIRIKQLMRGIRI